MTLSNALPINEPPSICMVAIVRDEDPFLDEWLLYHKMIGVTHFFLYDDNSSHILRSFLKPHENYVTVIDWDRPGEYHENFNNQMSAYKDAIKKFIRDFDWVIFLDADEFIALRKYDTLQQLLWVYRHASAVSLRWLLFGHNGYFEDPPSLITSSLTRRKRGPAKSVKTFSRTGLITDVKVSHYCVMSEGKRVQVSPGIASINHYHCRSFKRWMARAERGCAFYRLGKCSEANKWRLSVEGCLQQFVTSVAVDQNEFVDAFMSKFESSLLLEIENLNRIRDKKA